MNAPTHNVAVFEGMQANPVQIKGQGAQVVFLHGLLGPEWSVCLDTLAGTHRVIAPAHAPHLDQPAQVATLIEAFLCAVD